MRSLRWDRLLLVFRAWIFTARKELLQYVSCPICLAQYTSSLYTESRSIRCIAVGEWRFICPSWFILPVLRWAAGIYWAQLSRPIRKIEINGIGFSRIAWVKILKTLSPIFKLFSVERATTLDTEVRGRVFVENSECRVELSRRVPGGGSRGMRQIGSLCSTFLYVELIRIPIQ